MSRAGKIKSPPGFTLIELLVVLVLLALSASLVFGLNLRQRDSLVLRDFGLSLGAYLQLARSTALTQGRSSLCLLEDSAVSCSLLSKTLPVPVGLRLVSDLDPNENPPLLLMEYFMDGSALGGVISLTYKGHEALVDVDPLLGETTWKFTDAPHANPS